MVRSCSRKESAVNALTEVTRKGVVFGLIVILAVSISITAVSGATSVFENFEDGDITSNPQWSGDTSYFDVETGNPYEGTYALRHSGDGSYRDISTDAISTNSSSFGFWLQVNSVGTAVDPRIIIEDRASTSEDDIRISFSDPIRDPTDGSSTGVNPNQDCNEYCRLQVSDMGGTTANLTVYDQSGNSMGSTTLDVSSGDDGSLDGIERMHLSSDANSTNDWRVDYFAIGEATIPNKYKISGDVTDSNNEDLSKANITVKNDTGHIVAEDTTDHLGKYSVEVENGTYNVTASKTDYTEETKQITVDGADETANFKLKKFNQSIQLDVRMYMEHGQVSPYEVVVSVDGDRRDVTGEANVTSGDTNVVTIDSAAHEVIATNNTSINSRTYVRGEWTDSDGNTYTTERNVTVANATVENIQILPTFTRFSASISDETLMVIIIATGFGAAASLFSTSFAGIAAMTMLMLLGWLAGYVHNGMAIVTVLSAMFVGMNVAGNVDYTVRR